MTRRRCAGDSGNIAVVFALLLVALFGAGTLAVDFGQLYAEGRQLQNGAENGALAVAGTCARGGVNCNPAAATSFADSNANDSTSTVDAVCGTGTGLSACSALPPGARWNCSATAPTVKYVEVRTSTRQADGSARVPNIFFRGVDPSDAGKTVRACARAIYGTPTGLTSQIPLVMSFCDWSTAAGWNASTQTASNLAPPPPYTNGYPPASAHRTVYFHTNNTGDDCTGPAGQNLAGGFGWVDTARDGDSSTAGCAATTSANGTVGSDPGVSAPGTCNLSALLGKLIYVPVYSATAGSGNTGTYTIQGYAAFYMTGYRFSQQDRGIVAPLTDYPCGPPDQCISGYFTAGITSTLGATIGNGPNMGVIVVQPAA